LIQTPSPLIWAGEAICGMIRKSWPDW
jgi:hypothetical protein